MKAEEVQALAKAMAPVFREIMGAQVDALRKEIRKEIASALAGLEIPELPAPLEIPKLDTDALMKDILAAIPIPKDGDPGKDGAPGLDGAPGSDGVDGQDADMDALMEFCDTGIKGMFDAARAEFDESMAKAIAAIPIPKDGAPGSDGVDGIHGKDGLSPTPDDVAAVFERRFSDQLLSCERRFAESVERAIAKIPVPKDGKDGAPGKDGADAFPLDAFEVQLDPDGRTLMMSFEAGDVKQHKHIRLPIPIDRGVWREQGPEEGGMYVQGDGVTKDGSFWIAQNDDPQGAPGVSASWRLSVKRGRDGKDLRPNASTHDPKKGVSM